MRVFLTLLGLIAPFDLAAGDGAPKDEPVPTDAVAGIVKLFEAYPVVALGENHYVRESGDLYVALVRDPKFQAAVNDIVIEFASRHNQPLLDRYILKCEEIPREELRKVWRDTTKVNAWECPIYADWLVAIRDANKRLPEEKRLRVLAGDTAIDWSKTKTHENWIALGENNVSFAEVINTEVLAKKRKCLLVIGWGHILKNGDNRGTRPSGEKRSGSDNTTTLIEKAHPGSVAVIVPVQVAQSRINLPLAEGKKPSLLYPLTASKVGREPGQGRPPDRLDRLADALLNVGQRTAVPNLGADEIDKEYYDELQRRAMIEWGHTRFVKTVPYKEK